MLKPDYAFSTSSVQKYNACAAQFYFEKVSDYPSKRDQSTYNQLLGLAVHEGLADALISDDPLDAALQSVYRYSDKLKFGKSLREKAIRIIEYVVPELGIGDTFIPVYHDGEPLVEYKFEHELDGVRVKGMIDAVVRHKDGRVIALDWKVRGTFYPQAAIQMDQQLALYVAVLRDMGVTVDQVMQVQIRSEPPAIPTFTAKAKEYTPDTLSRGIGITTKEVFVDTLKNVLPARQLNRAILLFADKIKPSKAFISYHRIPDAMLTPLLDQFITRCRDIHVDTTWSPVMNAYICKQCDWVDECTARILKGS